MLTTARRGLEVTVKREKIVILPPQEGDQGAKVTTKVVRTHQKHVVTLSTWDFGGQEVYYPTHQFFLSDHSVYLLVWDMRRKEEDSKIGYWLQSIKSRADDASVILVGTHLDDPACLKRAIDSPRTFARY